MCECVNACCERVSVRVSVVPALCLLSRGENREGASRWERRGQKMWGNYGGVFLGGGVVELAAPLRYLSWSEGPGGGCEMGNGNP